MISEVQHPTPPQYEIALAQMEQDHPNKLNTTRSILNAVNKQAFCNLVKETEDGQVLPHTKVSLSLVPIPSPSDFIRDKKVSQPINVIEINMAGENPLNMRTIYDRTFDYMQEAKKEGRVINLTLVSIGQVDNQPITSVAEQFLPRDENERDNTRVIFCRETTGIGSLVAKKILDAREKTIAPTYPQELQALLEERGIEQPVPKRKLIKAIKSYFHKPRSEELPFTVRVAKPSYNDLFQVDVWARTMENAYIRPQINT